MDVVKISRWLRIQKILRMAEVEDGVYYVQTRHIADTEDVIDVIDLMDIVEIDQVKSHVLLK